MTFRKIMNYNKENLATIISLQFYVSTGGYKNFQYSNKVTNKLTF
jgi:hypothetical protein